MKYIIRFFLILALLISLIAIGLKISGNGFLIRGVWITYLHGETSATIDDLKFFDSDTIASSNEKSPWQIHNDYNKIKLSDTLSKYLEISESVAFLVLKEDKIIHEEYWDDYSDSSLSNSFSMAKSITTMLVEIAIEKGFIQSWDQKIIEFLDELKGEYREKLSFKHLSTMTAGLDWNEHYTNPFDITAKTYYGRNVSQLMLDEVPVNQVPGKKYEYQSGATQILGMALENATGKSLAKMASEWLWKPMGAEHDAFWRIDDKGGRALSFCCFNSNIRDYARFGKLLSNHGNWEGKQLLDSAFISLASSPFKVPYYGYSFWIDDQHFETPIYYMRGILGQYIISIPEKDLVIVRLGKHRLEKAEGSVHPKDFIAICSEVMKAY